MDAKKINDGLSVSPQIAATDLAEIAKRGFRSIICNRPDGEAEDQPSFGEIDAAARKAGLETRYIPVVTGKVGQGEVKAFGKALVELPEPILAYCRTGTRSTILWSLNEGARGTPLPEILNATKAAGYDMSEMAERIASGN